MFTDAYMENAVTKYPSLYSIARDENGQLTEVLQLDGDTLFLRIEKDNWGYIV